MFTSGARGAWKRAGPLSPRMPSSKRQECVATGRGSEPYCLGSNPSSALASCLSASISPWVKDSRADLMHACVHGIAWHAGSALCRVLFRPSPPQSPAPAQPSLLGLRRSLPPWHTSVPLWPGWKCPYIRAGNTAGFISVQ